MFKFFIIICSAYFISAFNKGSKEYFITNVDRTNYLHTSVSDTDNHIFPSNLKISVILSSKNEGLLFYSIDKNSNQFIVTIKYSIDFSMHIEFRGKKKVISVKELCICKICLNEKLNFQFGVKNNIIEIQCNENRAHEFSLQFSTDINKNYPLPNFDINDKISAYLWFINTPKYKNGDSMVYPNNDHLSGRFSNIMYKDIPLTLSIVGSSSECSNLCTDDLCNGGKCLETFQCKPICDCTEAFLNGEFCNSSISTYGKGNTNISFELLKLSWSGSKGDIFKISNKNITFGISFLSPMSLQFTFTDNFTLRNEFPGNYSDKDKIIFLIKYEFKFMKIRFKNGIKKWTDFQFYSYRHLLEEHFTEIKFLYNSSGDIVYKRFADDWKWYPINGLISFKSFENSSINETGFFKEKGYPVCTDGYPVCTDGVLNVVIGILIFSNIFTIVIAIFIFKRSKKKQSKQRRFSNAEKRNDLNLLIPNETSANSAIEENGPINIDSSCIGDVTVNILNSPSKAFEVMEK